MVRVEILTVCRYRHEAGWQGGLTESSDNGRPDPSIAFAPLKSEGYQARKVKQQKSSGPSRTEERLLRDKSPVYSPFVEKLAAEFKGVLKVRPRVGLQEWPSNNSLAYDESYEGGQGG